MNELALFAGAGGGILGGRLLGWTTVCAVEIDPYCCRVLMQRQDDGILEPFPIWQDIRTFDGAPWRGCVDIVTGGFPCQDISAAGKGAGIDGARSGLWNEMARVVREVRPRYVPVENSPMLTLRGLGRVLADLAALGFDARWGVLGAVHAGAPHRRERIWIVAAHADRNGEHAQPINAEVADAPESVADANNGGFAMCGEQKAFSDTLFISGDHTGGDGWLAEPDVGRVANGVASRVDRLKALGNGQVSAVVRLAWEILK